MFVYLIMQVYSNGVDVWTNVHSIYADETTAELKALDLNDTEGWISDDGMCEKSYQISKEKVL